ncbi:hypothetical protein ACFW9I_29490 [[Kitasatospora] papulosa]|uniref:hypothetical protein n=1 Tax=[Kitasatospora] papulosa TaxID=1464011 RepID=UPI003680FB13
MTHESRIFRDFDEKRSRCRRECRPTGYRIPTSGTRDSERGHFCRIGDLTEPIALVLAYLQSNEGNTCREIDGRPHGLGETISRPDTCCPDGGAESVNPARHRCLAVLEASPYRVLRVVSREHAEPATAQFDTIESVAGGNHGHG